MNLKPGTSVCAIVVGTLFAAFPAMGQQVGPCTSNSCGQASTYTASINCGQCNSGFFVLQCTCCQLLNPADCKQALNQCQTWGGTCNPPNCAKCCSANALDGGNETCVCLGCPGMQCGGGDCTSGGTRSAERQASPPVLIASKEIPVEFIGDAGNPVRLVEATPGLEENTLNRIELRFERTTRELAYMILTITLTNADGEMANLILTHDRTFAPAPLDPAQPIRLNVQAASREEMAKITVRTDYVHFLGEAPAGLYPSLYQEVIAGQAPVLREIRRIRARLSPSLSVAEAWRLFSGDGPVLWPLRTALAEGGVEALARQAARAEAILLQLGVK